MLFKIKRIFVAIGFFVVLPLFAFAQGGLSYPLPNPLKFTSWPALIGAIASFIFYIALSVAVIMFIWAGILFLTSRGNEQQITKAKSAFTWAVIGLILALVSSGLAYLIRDILNVAG